MELFEEQRELLGSRFVLKAFVSEGPRVLFEKAFAEIHRIEENYSRFIVGNQLSQLNASIGKWHAVSEELFNLLCFAQDVHKETNGAFDPSVKSILDGWGYNASYSLQEGRPGAIGPYELKNGHVKLSAEIDLGGLGKGYAIDRAFDILRPLENICVDGGGDLRILGKGVKGKSWRIAFEHPTELDMAIGQVDTEGGAFASSSPARRRWRNRHHLVNPASSKPAEQMLSVYVQAEKAQIADAYSTALFVMGFDKARHALKKLPVEALLVGPNGEMWKSDGFKGDLFA